MMWESRLLHYLTELIVKSKDLDDPSASQIRSIKWGIVFVLLNWQRGHVHGFQLYDSWSLTALYPFYHMNLFYILPEKEIKYFIIIII